jgi:hypothetical protein
VVVLAFGALALFAGGVTNWHTIKSALFPTKAASEASIVAKVESGITRQEFDRQAQVPAGRPSSTAIVTPAGPHRPDSGRRLAVYAAPVIAQTAGRVVDVAFVEPAKSQPTIKAEGEKITEEAKRDEESTTQEKSKASAEQKSAEEHVREEQQRELEARKRTEEPQKNGAVLAKAEEVKARREVAKASATVQAKKRATVRPPSQRRIEIGTSAARVEQVLDQADLPERCHPTCSLKPIVEKALKATSNDVAEAARAVRATVSQDSGARVHFKVTLVGLDQNVAVLTYSLVQANGAPPPEPYLDTVAVKHFTPAREREVVMGDCWVPVPSSSQQYYLLLTVYDGKTEVGSEDTSHFR